MVFSSIAFYVIICLFRLGYVKSRRHVNFENIFRFNYIKPNGDKSTYCPDFFVHNWNSFIEVKGYETELDRCKWSQFNKNLLILRKNEIDEIRKVIQSENAVGDC